MVFFCVSVAAGSLGYCRPFYPWALDVAECRRVAAHWNVVNASPDLMHYECLARRPDWVPVDSAVMPQAAPAPSAPARAAPRCPIARFRVPASSHMRQPTASDERVMSEWRWRNAHSPCAGSAHLTPAEEATLERVMRAAWDDAR